MVTAALVALVGIFVIGAAMKNIPWLWFLSGVSCWALGVWWVINPVVAGNSPINDILVIITFLGGVGLMFMMSWGTRTVNGREVSGFNIRLPSFMGGKSEEEEIEERRRVTRDWRERRTNYQERLTGAIRGRRLPPR
jgi:hypothetical protein